jgi:hypothetical protein
MNVKLIWGRLVCWWYESHDWGRHPNVDTCQRCGVRRTPIRDYDGN